MDQRKIKINRREIRNTRYKTNGDVLYFVNSIREFLGKEPILDFMAKKNETYKNIHKNRKRKNKIET